ncbi:DUF4351 domain-containing protein [Pistricoccus aurantiacus]|uniref:DUF4351 domain-containing protein n=1 Tax=Pistricoccus aurantiacus TaxID=1883414 RepID=A0A5B8SZ12_9GAMM|nr:DUF4351 domain-containing protein [Pistricoccus aurantiacus]QEA40050.1 DUF4351 domain-containing protein [Pistricoccus aurantiacus]
MSRNLSHDQNFKNLILDYPRQALAFFAEEEAAEIDASVTITPLRQEQLKERLGERFRELDVPLLVEWPDGRREALLFVLEEETQSRRFSIHRLAHYCLDLAELLATERVVPVVIFLREHPGLPRDLVLGSERRHYLRFDYLACMLASTPAERYLESDNLVARLNLPNMRWPPDKKVEIYARAIEGLLTLEPNVEKQIKYLDFVDIYTGLSEAERFDYESRYPQENAAMTGLAERLRTEGRQEGRQEGIQQGEQGLLRKLLERRFGPLESATEQRLQNATTEELEHWAENLLEAQSLREVFTQ